MKPQRRRSQNRKRPRLPHTSNSSFRYMPHCILYDSGRPGPLYVAPHAGIAFKKPADMQDEGTHYIAYKLADSGGKALISNMTRERDIGIDFFRSPPSRQLALKYYGMIASDRKRDTMPFRKRYAWVARDDEEHKAKQAIFSSFWGMIKDSREPIVFVHRQFLNPIRHPSLIDVIPFNYSREARKAVAAVNRKYSAMFGELFEMYKLSFAFKTKCILFNEKMGKSGLEAFKQKRLRIHHRVDRFIDKTTRMPYIELTYKKNFNGDSVKEMVQRHLLSRDRPILHLEISEFLTNRYPELAVHLVKDLMRSQAVY